MVQRKVKISPSITLCDIFGQNLVLNPRPPFSTRAWLPKDPVKLDFLTGSPLSVAGNMPVICNSSVITNEITSLMERANVEIAPFLHTYHTEKGYKYLLNKFVRQDKKLVFNHIHPVDEAAHGGYWINPELLSYLNNKANLQKIVPTDHVPLRLTVPPNQLNKVIPSLIKLPLVIKAVTDQSTGAGYAVSICSSAADVREAADYFRSCKMVVVEEFIEIDKVYNVQFAKTADGRLIYLGASEQITNLSGGYLGNWLYINHEPPKLLLEISHSIMKYASRLGFVGIGGFDIAMSKQNRALVIDLNFRLNGSTPALLLGNSIMLTHNASVLLFRTWNAGMEWKQFVSVCKDLMENNSFIPISIYDPSSSPYPNSRPLISGVLVGYSKQDILKKDALLVKNGLL